MANVLNSNSWYIDTASSAGTASTFLAEDNIQVTHIVFCSKLAADSIVLADKSATAAAAGSTKMKIVADAAEQTVYIDLADHPLVFPNGVWVVSLSPNAVCTLVGGKSVGNV